MVKALVIAQVMTRRWVIARSYAPLGGSGDNGHLLLAKRGRLVFFTSPLTITTREILKHTRTLIHILTPMKILSVQTRTIKASSKSHFHSCRFFQEGKWNRPCFGDFMSRRHLLRDRVMNDFLSLLMITFFYNDNNCYNDNGFVLLIIRVSYVLIWVF